MVLGKALIGIKIIKDAKIKLIITKIGMRWSTRFLFIKNDDFGWLIALPEEQHCSPRRTADDNDGAYSKEDLRKSFTVFLLRHVFIIVKLL